MKSTTSQKDFEELTTLFFEMRQILKRRMHGEKGKLDPNAWLRLETLRYVAHAKEPTMRDIAGFLCTRAPSATSLVNNLEKAGLVSRGHEAHDRRIVRITLTKKGKRVLNAYTRQGMRGMQLVFGGLPPRDIVALKRILAQVLRIHKVR